MNYGVLKKGCSRLFQNILEFLLPSACLVCGTTLYGAGYLCPRCFKNLEFITEPACQKCALPFSSYEVGGKDGICPRCQENPPLWNKAAAAFLYNEGIKQLILPLKYADQQNGVNFLVDCMWNRASCFFKETDFIVPVPLHKKRLRFRGYNQSALLAWQLGKKARKPVLPMVLRKKKHTPALGNFSKLERQVILKDAFEINHEFGKKIERKTIVLVDDVMTTGATLTACSEILLAGGVKQVNIVVIAKVEPHFLHTDFSHLQEG